MKYVVRTLERPYTGGDFKLYTRQMVKSKFDAMVRMAGFHIMPEFSETETEKNGDPKFMQYGMTFNSGLRHTACRVMSIECDNELIYQYGNNATKFTDKKFEKELSELSAMKNGIDAENAA